MSEESEAPVVAARPVAARMSRPAVRQGVAPAAYYSAAGGEDGNPLRGSSRAVGTGVPAVEE
jgi:hypothetical protein